MRENLRRAHWAWRCTMPALLIASSSCGDEPTRPPSIEAQYPPRHGASASSIQDSIVFQDFGVTCVYSGGAYVVDSTKAGIWIVDPAGQFRRRLLSVGTYPDWSRDGLEIVFELDGRLVITPTDSLDFHPITSGARDQFPDWSPVSDRIAFESTRQNPGGHRSIWTVNSDGSGLARVGIFDSTSWRKPDWSPDGATIVHVRYINGISTSEIFSMNQDGTNPSRLTINGVDDDFPQFSPDGTRIAFVRQDVSGTPQAWVMNSDGTAERQVTASGAWWPTWSRTGAELIYSRFDARSSLSTNGVLWKIDVSSGAESQILNAWPDQCP